jgi:hypothetical protein
VKKTIRKRHACGYYYYYYYYLFFLISSIHADDVPDIGFEFRSEVLLLLWRAECKIFSKSNTSIISCTTTDCGTAQHQESGEPLLVVAQ